MALLVTDQGEIDSLRTLLNATHTIPRNLVLKLYTAPSTAPLETDTPSQTAYFEPFNGNNQHNNGSAPTTGYKACVNNRNEEDQDFTGQYGKLLNGNLWSINTTTTAVHTAKVTGTSGSYAVTVDNTGTGATKIKKGDYAVRAGIPDNTYVVDIDGLNLQLSQKLTANLTAEDTQFGRGRTTASYPEEIFTFDSAAGNVYGYYLARANNMPVGLQGKLDGGSLAATGDIDKETCLGVVGNNYIQLKDLKTTATAISAGAQNSYELTVASVTGIVVGQFVEATNVPTKAKVVGVDGTKVYIDKAITGGNASGNLQCVIEVAKEVTIGQAVTMTGGTGQTGPDAFPANTVVTGITYATDTANGEQGPRIYLNNNLTANVGTASSNDKVKFSNSVMTTDPGGTAVAHKLNPGDVIYIAQGTSNGPTTAGHYTVFEVPTNSTFTTTPALAGAGDATLYSSIFFAEQFTNGPYQIQNPGDQIKVTLNVSLD